MKIVLEVENLVSPSEAAKMLKVSRQTIYNMIERGELHPIAIGNNRYFLKSELEIRREK